MNTEIGFSFLSPNNIMPLLGVMIYLGMIILISESLSRYSHVNAELTRKIVHIGSGNVILLAWWFNISMIPILAAAVIAGIIALSSNYFQILPSINSVGRQSLGTFFYAVSIGLLTGYFWPLAQPRYAVIGILIMTWGDGLAAIIGKRFGKHTYQLWQNTKSWEGSLTMALISFGVTFVILGFTTENLAQAFLVSGLVAIFATTLEMFSTLGIDNFTVPVGSAALCFYCYQILS